LRRRPLGGGGRETWCFRYGTPLLNWSSV
jgi:hypothetical protein